MSLPPSIEAPATAPGPAAVPAAALSRRSFLQAGVALGAAAAGGVLLTACPTEAGGGSEAGGGGAEAASQGFVLPALGYGFDALEPAIDAKTMEIHHGKHHAAYVSNLNAALAGSPDLLALPIEALLADRAARAPEAARQAVINNGGGHANHTLFWRLLAPKAKAASAPTGKLAEAVASAFGDLAKVKERLHDAGLKRFGSGWSWLVRTAAGRLEVISTANQDSPLMDGATPLVGIDVWEHAYYLRYQNRRADYLKAIWEVLDWAEPSRRFEALG